MSTGPCNEGDGRYVVNAWRAKTVSEILTVTIPPPSAEEQERHRIYCYMLFCLLNSYWNPYKHGLDGEYPWAKGTSARKSSYLGHNIAAIAVSSSGTIVDFDFNHNELFNSSIEHAEARLLRRLFALGHRYLAEEDKALNDREIGALEIRQEFPGDLLLEHIRILHEFWDTEKTNSRTHFSKALSRLTIYTTLESCAQCSGMMALGSVEKVVYLQPDPGQNNIGAIMFNLNDPETAFRAPLPVPASAYGVTEYSELSKAYTKYLREIRSSRTKPFYKNGNFKKPPSSSLTTFLCTSAVKKILQSAAEKFEMRMGRSPMLPLKYGDWSPSPKALNNSEVFEEANGFLNGAIRYGRRGTPHRM